MIELFLWKLLALGAKMLLAMIMLFGGLALFNKVNGESFTNVLKRIKKDPKAESDYYGRRAIAFSLVILGCLIGSF